MNKLDSNYLLSSIRTDVYCADDDIAKGFPNENLFDNRSDFILNLYQQGLAVLVSYITDPAKTATAGTCHKLRISLSTVRNAELLASTVVATEEPSPGGAGFCRVDFSFPYANACMSDSYRIEVRDEECGAVIGEKIIYMWRPGMYGLLCEEWFSCSAAGITRLDDGFFHKALCVDAPDYVRVRFMLRLMLPCGPETPPEFEIRVWLPDGTVQSCFCRPRWEEDEIYFLDFPLLITESGKGVCYAEAICMDNSIAGFVFSTDSEDINGEWDGVDVECMDEYSLGEAVRRFRNGNSHEEKSEELIADDFDKLLDEFIASQKAEIEEEEETDKSDKTNRTNETEESSDDEPFETTLDSLTGLRNVKSKLAAYRMLVEFNRKRRENDLPALSLPLHAMFLGSPGTGKTTVAKMMGKMLAKAGILSKGHVVVHERATLIGTLYGKEEANTREAIEAAQGGILFIDEAYQLFQPDDPRDPAKFVMETLLTALADESMRDWMLILAGYTDEMKRMFEMNPGLRSRIPESNIYVFDDFSESELMQIAENYLSKNSYTLSDAARGALSARLSYDYANRDRTFGNARHVINMIQTDIIPAMAVRVISSGEPTALSLSEIEAADIPARTVSTPAARRRVGFTA